MYTSKLAGEPAQRVSECAYGVCAFDQEWIKKNTKVSCVSFVYMYTCININFNMCIFVRCTGYLEASICKNSGEHGHSEYGVCV